MCVQHLFKLGADGSAKLGGDGSARLGGDGSAIYSHFEMGVELLLRHGANPNKLSSVQTYAGS